jgi:hypothetical protein
MAFIFTENQNALGIEAGKVYIKPAIWGLCMEKAIIDYLDQLEGRKIGNYVMIAGGTIAAPFTGGATLALSIATATSAAFDLCYTDIQQSQSLQEYKNNTTFRNAWNAIYTTIQIVDGIVAAPAVITSLPQFYKLVKESKYVLATKRFVKNNFFEFVRGKSVNQAGGTLFSKSAIANINGFSDNISSLTNNQGISVSSFKNLQLGTAVDLASTNPEGLAKLISIRNSIPNPNSNTILQKVIPLNKIDDFIVKGYKPRGSVSTAADSKHLNTWEEIYDGMRLDYKIDDIGTQAFYSSDNGCYVIRFKATNANQATPAVNLPDPDPFPYTNHGFTSGKNNLGIPEWKMPDAEISEGVIYRKNVDGSEVEYAIWDATLNKFILK